MPLLVVVVVVVERFRRLLLPPPLLLLPLPFKSRNRLSQRGHLEHSNSVPGGTELYFNVINNFCIPHLEHLRLAFWSVGKIAFLTAESGK